MSGTFDEFNKKADALGKRLLEAGVHPTEIQSKWDASIPAKELQSGEHVLFTIDFSESKHRLKQGFENWLDSRKEQFSRCRKLNGEIYRNRLHDRAYYRLWREHGENLVKEKNLPNIPINKSSRSEARSKARSFIVLLKKCEFQDIRDFAREEKLSK